MAITCKGRQLLTSKAPEAERLTYLEQVFECGGEALIYVMSLVNATSTLFTPCKARHYCLAVYELFRELTLLSATTDIPSEQPCRTTPAKRAPMVSFRAVRI